MQLEGFPSLGAENENEVYTVGLCFRGPVIRTQLLIVC